eukprot:Nitzschia sp. Nitz4//scaffold381_size12975//10635//12625//NITZ4_008990-RA/size12975-snap-gene-0.4-mRNA-1//1//CDS//3329549904//6051//frame0
MPKVQQVVAKAASYTAKQALEQGSGAVTAFQRRLGMKSPPPSPTKESNRSAMEPPMEVEEPVSLSAELQTESSPQHSRFQDETVSGNTEESPSSRNEELLDDRLLFCIVAASIAVVMTSDHLTHITVRNSVPFSLCLAWMFVAFSLGLALDSTVLFRTLRAFWLPGAASKGNRRSSSTGTSTSSFRPGSYMSEESSSAAVQEVEDDSIPDNILLRGNPAKRPLRTKLERFFPMLRRPTAMFSSGGGSATRRVSTSLGSKLHTRPWQSRSLKRLDSRLITRLHRFVIRRRSQSEAQQNDLEKDAKAAQEALSSTVSLTEESPPPSPRSSITNETTDGGSSGGGDHALGGLDLETSNAVVLSKKLNVVPIAALRGLDIFQSDSPDTNMATHPFLLQNGLCDVPTLLVNVVVPRGNVLLYFELPSFVQNCTDALVEHDSDPDDVKALKRFLGGDDGYRREHLKVLSEFVEAPYPVRFMLQTSQEVTVHMDGLVDTKYKIHDAHGANKPVFELVVDFMKSSASRGMTSMVTRHLKSISIDLAFVISKPIGSTEEEPEALLGLWRFHKIKINQYPELPDRFASNQQSEELAEEARANYFATQASQRMLGIKS